MTNNREFKHDRLRDFNRRANYHARGIFGFDINDPDEGHDLARSLFTEYADTFKTPSEQDDEQTKLAYEIGMARIALAVGWLEGGQDELMQAKLTQMVKEKHVPSGQKLIREYTFKIAGAATKSLNERITTAQAGEQGTEQDAAQSEAEAATQPKKKATTETYTEPEPDYADLQDVIKYLFAVGTISPSRAAILLVALGYERPEGEMSDGLKKDMARIRGDLRNRITAYRAGRLSTFQKEGANVIEAFLTQSSSRPELTLMLEDDTTMVSVGSTLIDLHRIDDIHRTAP